MQKKNQNQTKPVKQIIILLIAVILLLLIIFAKDIIKLTNKNKTNLAENNENELISNEPNTPQLSAGMIPVKWDGTNWIITTAKDKDWYDYSKGKPAYIMLNDGTYQSELIRNMEENGKKLARDNVGVNVPDDPNIRGTIFVWIPRFAYKSNEKNEVEIKYIKEEVQLGGGWTVLDTFSYTVADETKPNFSLSGVWVEKDVDTAYATKIAGMNQEESPYGFISNTKASQVVGSDTVVIYFASDKEVCINPMLEITDVWNTNRIVLKVVNTNKYEPIKAKAYYDKTEEKIKVEVTYRTNEITRILDSRGNVLSENSLTADTGDEVIGNKVYKYMILDNLGNIKEISTEVAGLDIYIIENEDDLKLFRDAVNANKTTANTKAYQIADVKMNEGKYTIDEETGDITFAEDAEQWTGITTTYYGKYYGNNHTISGIYGKKGIFDYCDGAEIKDLGIVESYITTSGTTGAILGCAKNNTILENCYNEATIKVSNNYIGTIIGGLVGNTYNSNRDIQLTMNKCYNKGKIIVDDYRQIFVGGLIGWCWGGNISNCYNSGEVILLNKVDNSSYIGGIVGLGNGGLILSNCYNSGNIIGCKTGGIIGHSEASINNSYNIGTIEGVERVGGILGQNNRGKVMNSYSKGEVKGLSNIGGVSGYNFEGKIQDCYYEENTTLLGVGGGTNKGTTKLTQDQMPTVLSVINSDNAFVEDTDGINNGYPLLAWQVQ